MMGAMRTRRGVDMQEVGDCGEDRGLNVHNDILQQGSAVGALSNRSDEGCAYCYTCTIHGDAETYRDRAGRAEAHSHVAGPMGVSVTRRRGMPSASKVVCQTVLPHQLRVTPPRGYWRAKKTRIAPTETPMSRPAERM